MMTQPIRRFNDLRSETAPAGGNTKLNLSFEERRMLELRARHARAEVVAAGIADAILWVGRQWRRLVEGVKAEYRLRAAEAQLHRMSDRELADIGLCRGDIHFAVREAAHGVGPEQLEGFAAPPPAANQNLRRAA